MFSIKNPFRLPGIYLSNAGHIFRIGKTIHVINDE